jgi:hypothetical protein
MLLTGIIIGVVFVVVLLIGWCALAVSPREGLK